MKVSLIALGCKVNQYESESIAKKLKDNGVSVSFGLEPSDVFVLSTCAVTNEAERKSRGYIAKIKKISPKAKIYVLGCSSQNNPSSFLKFDGVYAVYGTGKKMDIADLILKNKKGSNNKIDYVYEDNFNPLPSHTRAYIKIQDGCNNFCSYCLIPYLRGRSRSRNFDSVKAEIAMHAKTSKEVILTGIDLSSYGLDLSPKSSLAEVAKIFSDFPNLRFRFSSLEAGIITPEFLEVLKGLDNFCPHFHLSMQSGCDKTLKDMNRHYTSAQFLDKIKLIRKFFPDACVTTDVIVGFPTETEKDFKESYQTCKKANFAFIHIFPYSKRSGTVATKFPNLATNVKERVGELTKLRDEMATAFVKKLKGKVYNLLVESKLSADGEPCGHTENFIKCYLEKGTKVSPNNIYKVKIIEPYKDGAMVSLEEK